MLFTSMREANMLVTGSRFLCVRAFVRLILLMGVFTSNMCIVFRVNEVAYFKSEVKFDIRGF